MPALKNMPFERPSLVNLIHVSELHKESGSEDENIEENEKGENKKNMKESSYTNINEHKKREQAELLKDEKPKNITKSQEMKKKGERSCHQGNGPV